MEARVIRVRSAALLVAACSLIFGVIGASLGGEYTIQRMDAIDAAAAEQRATDQTRLNESMNRVENNAAQLERKNSALMGDVALCQEYFSSATLIYESAPQLNVAITGLRGLPIIPVGVQGAAAPRWWIPAKIKPQTYGDPRGAVYFYTKRDPNYTDGRLLTEGPFLPAQVNPQ
jgi:hypothetical protein